MLNVFLVEFGVSQIPFMSFWRNRDVINVPNVTNQTSFFFQFRFILKLDCVIVNENNGILVYLRYFGMCMNICKVLYLSKTTYEFLEGS